jgi:hypothetical protein
MITIGAVPVTGQQNYIRGSVFNADNETAIPNASVFITNSSIGTVTSNAGHFDLKNIPAGTYDLIISSVGFSTRVYSFSSDKLPLQLKIYLEPKVTELEAVIVEPYEKDGWEKWGSFFMENFIGTTDAARLCKLRNHKTLRFRHSKKNNTITAVADEPLIIENRELGYKIQYQLEDFSYNFTTQTLYYLGYTLFTEMSKNPANIPQRYLKARKQAYDGSIVHFMRSLHRNTLAQDGFEVRRMVRVHNTEKERIRALVRKNGPRILDVQGDKTSGSEPANTDSATYYNKVLSQANYEDFISGHVLSADSLTSSVGGNQRVLFFENYIQVVYKNKLEEPRYLLYTRERRKPYYRRSTAWLPGGDPVTIEKNGSYYPPTEFFSSGYWAWSEKISHLLPTDYDDILGR